MKKCPTCSKTFEDSMRFCQVDGTPLVDDVPAFDPYATIVAQPKPRVEPAAPVEPPAPTPVIEPPAPEFIQPVAAFEPPPAEPPAPIFDAAPEYTPVAEEASEPVIEAAPVSEPEPVIHQTIGSLPIHEPEDVLDLPSTDPLKTMYVSEAEMKAAFGGEPEPDVMEIPPIEETPAAAQTAEVSQTSFSNMEPPPSPFSIPENVADQPVAEPFDKPEADYNEAATMIQPSFTMPEPDPEPEPAPAAWAPEPTPPQAWTPSAPAPVAEWTPPPAPDTSWQNQEISSNTPFQPPPAGAGGQNNTLGLVSLIIGLVSFVCLYGIGGLTAIILGLMQRSRIKKDPAQYGGGGMAIAGIILGVINILAFIVFLIIYAGFILAAVSR